MRRLALTALGAALLAAGAFAHLVVDRPPDREAHDRVWMERMLDGRYGRWLETGKLLHPGFPDEDRVAAMAEGAWLTRYGLGVATAGHSPFAGDWWLLGGLVARAEGAGGTAVELFLKQIARTHWPMGTARYGRDYSYDVFLLVRPPGARARLVRQWHIPPADIVLFVPKADRKHARRHPAADGSPPPLQKAMHVEGCLVLDRTGTTATVTVLGLARAFEERVDIGGTLRR